MTIFWFASDNCPARGSFLSQIFVAGRRKTKIILQNIGHGSAEHLGFKPAGNAKQHVVFVDAQMYVPAYV